jgi:hypothetical protein
VLCSARFDKWRFANGKTWQGFSFCLSVSICLVDSLSVSTSNSDPGNFSAWFFFSLQDSKGSPGQFVACLALCVEHTQERLSKMTGPTLSLFETAWKALAWLTANVNPWWMLPVWARTLVAYTFSSMLFMGSGIAALLYVNQV